MSGPNDRRNLLRLRDAFTSEAEFLAEQQRRNEELFKQLEAECARSLEEYEAQAASNGQTNGHANGNKNGHKSVRPGGGVAGVEPKASPQSGATNLGAARTPTPATRTEALPKQFRLLTGAQLNSEEFQTRYLIPGVLAAGQPGGIFGSFKTLKTSLAADLMISLASGTPFLGRFPVPKPGKVLFLSGESGLPALRSIARRICAQRGLSLDSLDNFRLSPDLPRLDQPADVRALKKLIETEKPVCVVIDPAYLAMGRSNSRNLFCEGPTLAAAGRTVRVDRLHGAPRASLQTLEQSRRTGHAR